MSFCGSVALSNLRQKFLNEINANFYPLVLNATEPKIIGVAA